jgi:hypothetical protein
MGQGIEFGLTNLIEIKYFNQVETAVLSTIPLGMGGIDIHI